MSQKLFMNAADPARTPPEAPPWARFDSCGAEAVLPAGTNLALPSRPGRHCYLVLEGVVVIEWPDGTTSRLSGGSFIGGADADGRPEPIGDVTIRLESHARILVYQTEHLAALIDVDREARAAWQAMRSQPGNHASGTGRTRA